LMEKQRMIQQKQNQKRLGQILEVMVEGRNEARKQWIGRTSQNKTLNFTAAAEHRIEPGDYVSVLVTIAFRNSLVGNAMSNSKVFARV
ncbi:MAG TPA: TRAM domain-containing protein, partial [Terriglobales bacterium]|nr:TRAM domain-containing protein [Terriglobales bacterium]